MNITQLIQAPEQLDRTTLYQLRRLVAQNPCHQAARLLMLQNLYLLHDPTFDEELQRAAVWMTDRRALYNLVEAQHHQLKQQPTTATQPTPAAKEADRTTSLIDDFLGTMPQEPAKVARKHRKPTAADAAIDYVAYMIETQPNASQNTSNNTSDDRTASLIDNFINKEGGKINLADNDNNPTIDNQAETNNDENEPIEGYFTETLAKIYIKQGRYLKAFEIIQRLNLNYPKKSAYFADQMRYLEKLILNNKQ